MGTVGEDEDCCSTGASFSLSPPPIGKVEPALTVVEAERPYGRDVLWRVGLGSELGKGWERDALKLEEGNGSCVGFFFFGDVGWVGGKECGVLLSAILAGRIYNEEPGMVREGMIGIINFTRDRGEVYINTSD